VVADCPPLLPVRYAADLQQQLDGFVFVARERHAPREAVRRAASLLARGRIAGLVLNDHHEVLRPAG
jgi:Mrp family chromosome partitioning ATPase